MVIVTYSGSLVLALMFAVGSADLLAVELVSFTALPFPLFKGFALSLCQ